MDHIKQILEQGLYESFSKDYPAIVSGIEQLLKMGESPEKIAQEMERRFPGKPIIVNVTWHIANHAKTIQGN